MRYVFFLMAVLLSGVGIPAPAQTLEHAIPIPPEHAIGCSIPITCLSAAEVYVSMYEKGWWNCMAIFASDIDSELTASDRAANGGPVSVEAFAKGCTDAEARVSEMRQEYGTEETITFLKREVSDRLHPESGASP